MSRRGRRIAAWTVIIGLGVLALCAVALRREIEEAHPRSGSLLGSPPLVGCQARRILAP